MADWYYARDGRQQGPITSAQLRQMAQSGELRPDDLVFKEGGTTWIPASSVQGLFPAGGVATRPAVAPGGGRGGEAAFAFDAAPAASPGAAVPAEPAVRPPRAGGSNFLVDLLLFRRMVAPTIILILFYLFVAGVLLGGLIMAVAVVAMARDKGPALLTAIGILIMIPIMILVYRLWAELMIVIFRIYESLRDLQKQQEKHDAT